MILTSHLIVLESTMLLRRSHGTTHNYLSSVKLIIVVSPKKINITLLSHGSCHSPKIDSMTRVQIAFLGPLVFFYES